MGSLLAYYIHDLSPFLIRFSGDWGIRYYGLAYLVSFWILFWGMGWFFQRGWSEVPLEKRGDLLTWAVVGTLLGGRLGYCLFYDWDTTWRDPLSVIAFWRGGISGMASHGGFVGVVLAIGWFARRHRYAIWKLYDAVAIWATPGFFLGRLANFINGELWGRPATIPWAVIFPDSPLVDGRLVPRHPSQLYQALLEGLLLFVLLMWMRWRNPRPGLISAVMLAGYGVARIVGECFREPDAHIGYLWGGLTQGQVLSFFLIFGGGVVWWISEKADARGVERKTNR
ncbi:MAG: prolipoprotein diacylglyceryl transferase [Candidatus Methylacidiphilales bacterium]